MFRNGMGQNNKQTKEVTEWLNWNDDLLYTFIMLMYEYNALSGTDQDLSQIVALSTSTTLGLLMPILKLLRFQLWPPSGQMPYPTAATT